MSRKLFAETITTLGSRTNLSANECERFGITWGCKPDCPVFERGECEDVFFENLEEFIKTAEYDKEDAINQINVYKRRLTKEKYRYLIGLTDSL